MFESTVDITEFLPLRTHIYWVGVFLVLPSHWFSSFLLSPRDGIRVQREAPQCLQHSVSSTLAPGELFLTNWFRDIDFYPPIQCCNVTRLLWFLYSLSVSTSPHHKPFWWISSAFSDLHWSVRAPCKTAIRRKYLGTSLVIVTLPRSSKPDGASLTSSKSQGKLSQGPEVWTPEPLSHSLPHTSLLT